MRNVTVGQPVLATDREETAILQSLRALVRLGITAADDTPPVRRLVSAAMLMDDGLIVPGVRHFSPDMRKVLHRIYGDGYHLRVKEQGFVDTHGFFLGRKDAWERAAVTKQIRRRCGGDRLKLFSENLY